MTLRLQASIYATDTTASRASAFFVLRRLVMMIHSNNHIYIAAFMKLRIQSIMRVVCVVIK